MESGGHDQAQAPHIVSLPGWGLSHIIPHAQLVKSLVVNHGFTATIVTLAMNGVPSEAEESFLSSLPAGINSVSLPPADVPANLFILNKIFLTIVKSLPAFRDLLHRIKATTGGLAAVILDPFCADAFDVAREVGIPAYLFGTSNLYYMSLCLHFPAIVESSPNLPDVIQLPGFAPLPRNDYPDGVKDVKSDVFALFLSNVKRYPEAKGILVNTFMELEPVAAAFFAGENTGFPPVYLVGPLLKADKPSQQERAECLTWLDKQPENSVVYINFGSMAMLTYAQTIEMAHGLELSGHRFLWVLRPPVDKARFGDIVSDDPLDYLPEGFLERTKEVGLVVPRWAPQVEILSHSATEGFLTHCGWNSTIETMLSGLAMIAWPIYAEQAMNAAFLVRDAKMALQPESGEDGIVKREEIARVVRELMEGEQGKVVRENVRRYKAAAEDALTEDGNSYKVLKELAKVWKASVNQSMANDDH